MLQPVTPHPSFGEDLPWVVADHGEKVWVTGVLDEFTAGSVESQLLSLTRTQPELLLDLTETRMLTSGGVAMIQRCVDRAAELGHRLHLRASDATLVQRVLALFHVPHEVVPA